MKLFRHFVFTWFFGSITSQVPRCLVTKACFNAMTVIVFRTPSDVMADFRIVLMGQTKETAVVLHLVIETLRFKSNDTHFN